jgi:hypothetical protein
MDLGVHGFDDLLYTELPPAGWSKLIEFGKAGIKKA